jgi:sugar (pentulose or hexulose) kinase
VVSGVARALGVAAGTPVVIGSGDRAAEVLGSGATASCPMVSWGTTANVSVPRPVTPRVGTDDLTGPRAPDGIVLSPDAEGGWLLEGGLSAAGSLLVWLADLTGHSPDALAGMARTVPPGGSGVVAGPWLEGARAPWWRDRATASFVGMGPSHTAADLGRACFEAVAWDVQRCLEAMGVPAGSRLVSTGGGSTVPVWLEVLSGITGRTVEVRRSGQAASAGAALLAARAVGRRLRLADLDPVVARTIPDAGTVAAYRALRPRVDAVAAALVALASDVGTPPCG